MRLLACAGKHAAFGLYGREAAVVAVRSRAVAGCPSLAAKDCRAVLIREQLLTPAPPEGLRPLRPFWL